MPTKNASTEQALAVTMKRESGGKPVKPYEAWCETVGEVTVGEDQSPKATPSEA